MMRRMIIPTPFEQLLEALHAAQTRGDTDTERELRATIETDLAERERKAGIR